MRNLSRISETLIKLGRDAGTPAAVIEKATFDTQKVVVGSLSDIAEKASELSPPATIVIGELAAMSHDLAWFNPKELEDNVRNKPQLLAI